MMMKRLVTMLLVAAPVGCVDIANLGGGQGTAGASGGNSSAGGVTSSSGGVTSSSGGVTSSSGGVTSSSGGDSTSGGGTSSNGATETASSGASEGLESGTGGDAESGRNGGTSGGGEDTSAGLTAPGGSTSVDSMSTGASEGASSLAPLAVDDVFYGTQQLPLSLGAGDGLLINDSDPEEGSLTVVDFDAISANGATVSVSDAGAVEYEAPAVVWGSDTFEYTIADETGVTATATVTVHVAPVLISASQLSLGFGGLAIHPEVWNDGTDRVKSAGDINGDGLEDILIASASKFASSAIPRRVYVVFGRAEAGTIELGEVFEGIGGFAVSLEDLGPPFDPWFSFHAKSVGDVDADGLDDIVISMSDHGGGLPSLGRSYVVFGKKDTEPVELSDVAGGSGGFGVFHGANEDIYVNTINGAGDVNGDGFDDIILGSSSVDPTGEKSGRSYVVFGKTSSVPVNLDDIVDGVGGFAIDGAGTNDGSARSVAGAGDFNGDGLDDVVIGATGEPDTFGPLGPLSQGRAYVVFGKGDTASVELSAVAEGTGGRVMVGETLGDRAGWAVGGAGDVNGDGLVDLLVGSRSSGPHDGRMYLVFGTPDTDPLPLSAVAAGVGGFAIDPQDPGDQTGSALGGDFDFNGDGLSDLVFGAQRADYVGQVAGRAYVVYGKSTTEMVNLVAPANGVGGFAVDGAAGWDWLGGSVSGLGDVNGDGVGDIIVADSDAEYVIFGVPTGPS